MDNLTFNILHLYIEEASFEERFIRPNFEMFEQIPESFHVLVDDVYYEVNVKQKQDEYIWFVFDFGKPNPIDEHITNIKTGEKRKNQRSKEEAELTHQIFGYYDFKTMLFYYSNLTKVKFFEKIMREKFELNFHIDKILKSKDEFIKIIREVDEISFTELKHLFNADSKQRQALIDLTGTEAPECFKITANYSDKVSIDSLATFFKFLIDNKKNNNLKELVIRGTDEKKFNFVYNVESFIRKFTIKCHKLENGKFDVNEVQEKLLNGISNEKQR